MMGTIRQIKPASFPPPACDATTHATAATATRTSNRNSTSSMSSKYSANNANKMHQAATATTTEMLKTATNTPSNATQQKQQDNKHLHPNNYNNNTNAWQTLKAVAASLLPLLAFLLLLSDSATPTQATPVFVDNPSLAQFQSGRNIRHLPCIVRKSGRSGVCMFAIDCIKQNGTHLGTCIDRFYFGSCCQLKDDAALFAPEISDNSIDQNTISHFPHESTTLPTSTLFKLTTLGPHHTVQSSSNSISETVRNVTQSYLQQNSPIHGANGSSSISNSDKGDTTPIITTNTTKPVKLTTTTAPKRPAVHTTHKTSQFVVRTTAKPTVAPTTIKPPRRKTTVTRPVLTTTATQLDTRVEVTTQPPKFFTFQIVETTTPSGTESNIKSDEVTTTQRPVHTTNRYRPRPTTTEVPTQYVTTTLKPAERFTTRPRPLITRRPTTSRKPPQTKPRPTSSAKPTRRPVDADTNEAVKPILLNVTTTGSRPVATTHRRPTPTPATTISNDELPTTVQETKVPKPAESVPQTTHAPRPRPQPTAEIVKVPFVSAGPTTASPAPTTSTTTAAPTTTRTTTKRPSSTTTHTKPTAPSTTTTTTARTTTTTQKPTTPKPHRTTTTTTSTTTTRAPISSTTPQPPVLTTDSPKVEVPMLELTTTTPGLITWTNIDNEPTTINATFEWGPPPTALTQDASNKTAESPITTNATAFTTSSPPITSTMISVSTSISEIMSNITSIMPKPERPSSVMSTRPPKPKPTKTTESPAPSTISTPSSTSTTTTTTTTTPKPKPKPTIPSTTTTSTTTTTTTTTTTEAPIELVEETSSSTTSAEQSTEGFSTTGSGIFGTTDYSTEDFNGTLSSSTSAPVNSLEGMDYRQICGRRMFPEPRIVGGSNAAFGRWPWQISLRQWRTSTYLHKCGAALLNENWAITAAHCVENVPPSDLLLRMGEYDLAEEEEPYGYQERRVQIVASHPQFDARTFEYDLALLRFYEPVVFQPNIIPVCVPNSDIDFVGQTAFVTGWGRLYENGPLPSVLQEVAVPVINNTICESMYRVAGFIEHIPHIFICAGWKKGGYDSCEGDSGGPMVLQREDDKRFQLGGVISWGIGCAEANQPGVYTRISEFRDWINQILQF
ncbi:serine proteinase stubble isoform X2 [Zeugodacus cucurbitae]|uniref:Serine proteinase stubble n=1 Tax=Zeugodacus cucurbitae TaxID=28588 RepID=A0A0A1XE97_ZEUCU|nr:serine proteinase stubble isoform X2 [Zeugodacus cucurbitae]XP_054090343.1 serine proteinase stubble isoform X2 [Zeugodacus cucurbitae]XP_054090345.1 serine proteinase stubble isoform X2 [Zeugodacus cucurbitae]